MKSESCWRLYNIQSKNSIVVMWSVQICIARMGVDGGGVRVKACPDFCGTFCIHPDGQFLVLGASFKLFQIWGPFQIGAVVGDSCK